MYDNIKVRNRVPSCECKDGLYSKNRDSTSDECLVCQP